MDKTGKTQYPAPVVHRIDAFSRGHKRSGSYPTYKYDPNLLGDARTECFPTLLPSSRRKHRHRKRMQRIRTFSFNMHRSLSGMRRSGKKRRSKSSESSDSGEEEGDLNSTESYDSGNVSANERGQRKQYWRGRRQPQEGQLYKYTNVMKGWQYRWFVLEPDAGRLDYFEKEEHKLQKARGTLFLSGAVISPSDEDSQTFTINAANAEIYRLRAMDAKERQHWVNRLRATAEFHTDSIVQNLPPFVKENRAAAPPGHQQLSRHNSGSLDSLPGNRSKNDSDRAATLPNMYSSADTHGDPSPSLSPNSVPDVKILMKNSPTSQSLPVSDNVPKLKRNASLHLPISGGRGRNQNTPKGVAERSAVVVLKRSQHKHTSSTSSHQGMAVSVAPPSPGRIVTASQSEDCFRNAQDMLALIQTQRQDMVDHVEDLPSSHGSGDSFSALDKDILLLKATSGATLACLEQCLTILQQQQQVAINANPVPPYGASADWYDSKPLQLTLPVPTNRLLSDPASPADSYVSASSMAGEENLPLPPTADDNTDASPLEPDDPEGSDEYKDEDLGVVEEHKSVILHLLSQLKLGMDLTKVVLPTFILEKRSLLELFADCMAHPDMVIGIADLPSPEDRMLAVVEWYLTSFHAGKKGSVAKKPYNPIIGETFHCTWEVPPTFQSSQSQLCSRCHSKSDKSPLTNGVSNKTDSSSSISEDNIPSNCAQVTSESPDQNCSNGDDSRTPEGTKVFYTAEQVSHHPPVSAFYFECPEKRICMNGSIWTKSKFMGMSIGVVMVGKVHLTLADLAEEYEFSLPSAYARSILTIPWVELGDKVQISCLKTGYSASVTFHTKPFYGGKLHKVSSEVKSPSGEVICKGAGEWNGAIDLNYANGESKVINTACMKVLRKCVRPISQQDEFESRKLWCHVTEGLKKGDINAATKHKQFLEERQRRAERHRKETNTSFPTKNFHKEGERWVYNKALKATSTPVS